MICSAKFLLCQIPGNRGQGIRILSITTPEGIRWHLTCTNKDAQADEQNIARNERFLALPAMHLLCVCSMLVPSEFPNLRKRSGKKLPFCTCPAILRGKVTEIFGSALSYLIIRFCLDFGPGDCSGGPQGAENGLPVVHTCWCTLGALIAKGHTPMDIGLPPSSSSICKKRQAEKDLASSQCLPHRGCASNWLCHPSLVLDNGTTTERKPASCSLFAPYLFNMPLFKQTVNGDKLSSGISQIGIALPGRHADLQVCLLSSVALLHIWSIFVTSYRASRIGCRQKASLIKVSSREGRFRVRGSCLCLSY